MATKAEIIKRLSWVPKYHHVAVAIWQPSDVMDRAEEREIFMTIPEANDVIDRVDNKQDCAYGITWDTLDFWIDECVREREE